MRRRWSRRWPWHDATEIRAKLASRPAAETAAAQRHQDHDRHRQIGPEQAGNRRPVHSRGQAQEIAAPRPDRRANAQARRRGAQQDARRHHRGDLAGPRRHQARHRDEPMCLNPEAVKAAIEIGAVIEETACRKARRGEDTISARSTTPATIRRRRRRPREADVVFCAHEILFQAPTAIGEDFGLVIVDEGFWQDGISGVAAKSRLVIDSLADELKDAPVRDKARQPARPRHRSPPRQDRAAAIRAGGNAGRLRDAPAADRRRLAAGDGMGGRILRASRQTGMGARKVDPGLRPNSSDEDRQEGGQEVRLHQANTQALGNVEGARRPDHRQRRRHRATDPRNRKKPTTANSATSACSRRKDIIEKFATCR